MTPFMGGQSIQGTHRVAEQMSKATDMNLLKALKGGAGVHVGCNVACRCKAKQTDRMKQINAPYLTFTHRVYRRISADCSAYTS